MESNKDILINQLKKNLLKMVALVNQAIEKSVSSFINQDNTLAKQIIHEDEKINYLETLIESIGLKCLALYQPEASDLRFIIGFLRMVTDIERMGDLAVNIAESFCKSEECKEILSHESLINDISYMSKITISMLQDAINSVMSGNKDLAKSVIKRDEQVDQLNHQIFKELLASMIENPQKISKLIQCLLVSRNLERIADHTTNIAESAIFIYEGKNIKHHTLDEE